MRIVIVVLAALMSGCGVYLHNGGGAYTFIGPGSSRVGRRCSSLYQTSWKPWYDYSQGPDVLRKEGK